MNGLMNNRAIEDEIMIAEIGKTAVSKNTKVVIYDARPKLNAMANKLKSGGFEDSRYYRNSELVFCDIDNIHAVRSCF